MSDTIKTMSDYIKVDILDAGQLEIDDLILVDGEVVNVVTITSLPIGYSIEVVNDFGEHETFFADDFEKFSLMMLSDYIE